MKENIAREEEREKKAGEILSQLVHLFIVKNLFHKVCPKKEDERGKMARKKRDRRKR